MQDVVAIFLSVCYNSVHGGIAQLGARDVGCATPQRGSRIKEVKCWKPR